MENNKRPFNDIWDEMLESFDFDQVYDAMYALKWEWFDAGIPSKKRIIEFAKDLAFKVYNDGACHSSGGFICDYNDSCIHLSFVVSSFDIYAELG